MTLDIIYSSFFRGMERFRSDLGAISERFWSDFGALSERFRGDFGATPENNHYPESLHNHSKNTKKSFQDGHSDYHK